MEPWTAGTPDIPASAASFTIHSSIHIAAPAALVFRTLRNTDTWRDWNRFVPRVTITFQPPDADEVTAAEISELVQNTSIRGSVDSDITDGASPGTRGLTGRSMSIKEEDDVRLSPPPVTRTALRRLSAASGMSGTSSTGKTSGVGDRPKSQGVGVEGLSNRRSTEAHLSVPSANGVDSPAKLSAAQRFEASRRASVASGRSPSAADDNNDNPNNVMIEAPHDPNVLVPAPPTAAAKEAKATQLEARRPSSATMNPLARRMLSINAIYGEPSVRIQVGTKMIFHCRMKMPSNMQLNQETAMVVTEVSRPDDDNEVAPGNLKRTETHTLSRTGVYRIVWSMQAAYSPPKSFPKFLLQAQRVHEIRPYKTGDGREECEYVNWECQRGALAGQVKKRYATYLQERFDEWGRGLGGYAEAMGGAVERRDFSVG